MPADYGLLTQNLPQLQPQLANMGKPLLSGMDQASQMQLRGAMTQGQDLKNSFDKLSYTNQIAASVMFNPTQENLDAALKSAKAAGIDVSSIPTNIEDAKPAIQNAFMQSNQMLGLMKARAQIAQSTALMGKDATQANWYNFQQNKPPIFPGATGENGSNAVWNQMNFLGGYGGLLGLTPSGMQSTTPGGSTTPSPQTGGGQQTTPPPPQINNPNSGALVPPPQLAPYLNKPVPSGPAGIAQQKQQAEDWNEMKQQYAAAAAASRNALPFLYDARERVNKLGSMGQGPIMGKITGQFTDAGSVLTKDSAQMQEANVLALKGTGERQTNAQLGMLAKANINPETKLSTNLSILDKSETNQKLAQLDAQALAKLEQYGIQNPIDAQTILNKVFNSLNFPQTKNAAEYKMDPKAVRDYWDKFQRITGIGLQGNYMSKSGGGAIKTASQINQMAADQLLAPEDIINKYDLVPQQDTPTTGQYNRLPMTDTEVKHLRTLLGRQ